MITTIIMKKVILKGITLFRMKQLINLKFIAIIIDITKIVEIAMLMIIIIIIIIVIMQVRITQNIVLNRIAAIIINLQKDLNFRQIRIKDFLAIIFQRHLKLKLIINNKLIYFIKNYYYNQFSVNNYFITSLYLALYVFFDFRLCFVSHNLNPHFLIQLH